MNRPTKHLLASVLTIALGCSSGELSPARDWDPTATEERSSLSPESAGPIDGGIDASDDPTARTSGEEALEIVRQIVDMYQPFAAARGAQISIKAEWENTSGVFEPRLQSEYDWIVVPKKRFLDGNQYLTRDVARLLTCHEMGHLFAGFPFTFTGSATTVAGKDLTHVGTWLSAEGSSDYFATKDCVARVWKGDRHNRDYRNLAPKDAITRCDEVWSAPRYDQDRRDVCYRSIVVARELNRFFKNYPTYQVDITTPDGTQVESTARGYPSVQCRFDTMVAGALCNPKKEMELGIIPGLVRSDLTGHFGDHSDESEAAAADYSCYEGYGARPTCWFKPNMREEDCGIGVSWTRCEQDNTVLTTCELGKWIMSLPCSLGCVEMPTEGPEKQYACKEDLPNESPSESP